MRRRGTAGAIVCVGLILLAGSPSLAATASVTLGKTEVEFKPASGGGTASVALTNLTDESITDITAVAKPPAPTDCKVDLDNKRADLDNKRELPPQQTVTFTATATSCGKVDDALTISITAGGATLPDVTAKVDETKNPAWGTLWVSFVLALVVASVLMVATWKTAKKRVTTGLKDGGILTGANGATPSADWGSPLPYLKDTWSFKDSWASNVTLVAGLLAGVFGASDVLKGVLGDDTDEALTLATIGGAVSAGLIGVAGVLAIACKTVKDGKFTVGGVLLGSAVALGAGGGQTAVVYLTARELELGLSKGVLIGLVAVTGIILAVYGYLSVQGVLVQGATPPPAPAKRDPVAEPVSETVFAAALIAAASNAELKRGAVDGLLKELRGAAAEEAKPTEVMMPDLLELMAAPAMTDSGRSALP